MVTWSETRSTSCSRCDENRTVRPSSAMARMIASRMSRRTIGSSPADGSSSTSNSGRWASATSKSARARWPLDRCLTRTVASSSNRPRNSTTGSARGEPLAIMALFLLGARLHDGGALAQQLKDLFDADVQLARLGEQGVDAFGYDFQAFPAGEGRAGVRDVGAGGAAL